MYAITISYKDENKLDFDKELKDFKLEMNEFGYFTQNNYLFFGDPDKIDMVTGIISLIKLSKSFTSFFENVQNISILRIDIINDLTSELCNNNDD